MGTKYWDALALIQAAGAPALAQRFAANTANDAAGNAAGNAAISGTAELWGKPIPITWGRRRITGQLLQIGPQSQKTETVQYRINPAIDSDIIPFTEGWYSNLGSKTETRFQSTFAYCFGQPGNKTARQILTKLWFNGQLVYDVNQGQLSNEVRFKLYQGDELQEPDTQLNGTRYTYPVAYRGLMYIVFYNYSIAGQTSQGNPTVEAEFAEELTNDNPVSLYSTYGSSLAVTLGQGAVDPKKGTVYVAGNDGRLYKFDIATKALVADVPVTNLPTSGPAWSLSLLAIFAFARLNNTPYVFCTASANNVQGLYMINADTGVCVTFYHHASGFFAPAGANARASTYQGVGCIYLAIKGVTGNAYMLRCTETSITLILQNTITSPNLVLALSDGRLVHSFGADIFIDNVAFYTMPQTVVQLFYSSIDDTLVAVSAAGPFPWSIRKLTFETPPVVKWEITNATYGNFTFPIGSEQFGPMSLSGLGGDQRVAWANAAQTGVLDLISGAFELVPRTTGTLGARQIYDAFSNTIITTRSISGAYTLASYPIFNQTSGNMLLSTFLRDVALLQGYELVNITIEGITDQIIGACITQQTDIESMLNDVRRAYNFQIIRSGKKIRFTRRAYGTSLVVDGSYTEDQRAVLSEGEDEVVITVQTETSSPTQAAGSIVLNYIDPDYQYTVVPFQYKRNDPAYDVTVTDTLDLPIIMTNKEAAALAARVLIDGNIAETTSEFRLPQRNIAHEPGDLIELVFDEYTDTVRAVEISYNGDFSLSIRAEAVYTQDGPTYDIPPPVLPPEPPSLLGGEAMPLILDTTLIRPTDQYAHDTLETYLGAVSSGRLPLTAGSQINKSIDNAAMAAVASIPGVLTVARLTSTMSAGPVLIVNYDEVITCQLVQGDGADFHTDTLLNMFAGANRLLIGQPGRWEQVGYVTAAYDSATRRVTLAGIVRGWRGTELFAGSHMTGDYVIPVPDPDALIMVTDDVGDLDKSVVYAASDAMLRLNYVDAQGGVISGLTRRPWAPYNVHAVASAGDVAISWKRRTRLHGPLNNGSGTVPLDEATEAYRLNLYRAGALVRTVELTAPSFTYTSAMQTADGWSGSIVTLQLEVMQLSELVGPGFIKAGTYDVE